MSINPALCPPQTILQAYRSLPEGTMAQLIQNRIIISPAPLDTHQVIINEIYQEPAILVKKNKPGTSRVAP